MKKLIALALAATSMLASTAANAATLVDFVINTGINGSNVPGAPTDATITGTFDYEALGAGTTTGVSNFNVLLASNGLNYGNFPGGVTANVTNLTNSTGTLNFFNAGSTIFSFDISNFGAMGTSATTVSNATNFTYGDGTRIGITAGSEGRISVAAAVPEPATWAMMLIGFGAIGATMRRRKQTAVVSFA
ncbi:PEPxxWA-CTERM sorting domain-containing protein [Sphingomonas floccifaciens]|uniref:PEPxxWA-CTERM sorting domain-containing protein n=1 Tax=Sphingomonas floccifaciens TaxID=1844115 RepID=A0ABW4N7Z0_9SPHN